MGDPWRASRLHRKMRLDCKRKVAHFTHNDAQAALEEVKSNGRAGDDALVYSCGICGHFHWGRPINPERLTAMIAKGVLKDVPA